MKAPRLIASALFAALALSNCAAVGSAVTGQPIQTTPVQREGGKPFNVATTDVLRAEVAPAGTVWGLYDAGLVAAKATEIIDSGK